MNWLTPLLVVGALVYIAFLILLVYAVWFDHAPKDTSTETHDSPQTGLCGRRHDGECNCGRHV